MLLAVWALLGTTAPPIVWIPIAVAVAGAIAATAAGRSGLLQMEARLREFTAAVDRIAEGDLAHPVSTRGEPIGADLARAINRMMSRLDSRYSQVAAEQDQLRAVLNSMIEGVIALDARQRVLLINAAACRMLGLRSDSAQGRLLGELVRNPQLDDCVNRAQRQNDPIVGEIELLKPGARTLSVGAMGLSDNPSSGVVVVVHDVTELRRLERVRQEFVANASHELKTPLASISACVATLLEGAIDDDEHRMHFLQAIAEQAGRLDALVSDLLGLARADSTDAVSDTRPVSLEGVAGKCVAEHRQAAQRKEISVSIECGDKPVMVMGDEDALEQILDNLLDNAIKYTPATGSISVRIRVEKPYGVVDVTDTGIGIPQSHINRVFERFYRVDRARSRELGGTGLGLAIVKHLVQHLGGQVTAESQVGKGSTFTVRIPLAE